MKYILLFLLTITSLVSSCASSGIDTDDSLIKDNVETGEGDDDGQSGDPGSGEYELVWEDSFEGEALDDSRWTPEINGNGCGNAELEYYRSENISVGKDPSGSRGCLVITARREKYDWASFTSGRLTTQDKFEFTHGIVEASIMMPETSDGLWPAFWLLGADIDTNSWPRCGEIDIVEMGNSGGIAAGTQSTYFNGACHWGYYRDGAYPNYSRHTDAPYSIQDGEFHLFTLEWDENYIRTYLDRDKYPDVEPYFEMGVTDKSDDWGTGYYFHKDFFIILNLAVGGRFTGILQPSGITALKEDGAEARMYVDYVKVYQKQ